MEGLSSQGGMPEDVDTTWAEADIAAPEKQTAASKLTLARLISSVWTAASSYRGSDKRRGGNGARIRLEPPSHWEVDVLMAAGTP
jgi:catalase-peroxidase